MRYSEAKHGRVFVLRLEDGEVLHEVVESFAVEKGIKAAALTVIGGADAGSKLVVGPRETRRKPIDPVQLILDEAHEITGNGTLFPDKDNKPILHMHISCGRQDSVVTGCIRRGVKVWHVMEVVIFELLDTTARRLPDKETGFELLVP